MKYLTMFFAVSLVACSGSDNGMSGATAVGSGGPNAGLLVYDSQLLRSCGYEENRTRDESAQVLIDTGIDVIASYCARLSGVAFQESCFSPTGEIYVHELHEANQADAEALGYAPVSSLAEFETNEGFVDVAPVRYELVECSNLQLGYF